MATINFDPTIGHGKWQARFKGFYLKPILREQHLGTLPTPKK